MESGTDYTRSTTSVPLSPPFKKQGQIDEWQREPVLVSHDPSAVLSVSFQTGQFWHNKARDKPFGRVSP